MSSGRSSHPYKRRRLVVNPTFQYRFVGVMLLVLLLMTVGTLASVYLALWMTMRTFDVANEPLAMAELTTVGLMVTMELLLLAPVIVWVGIRLTHKVAGPLVRINAAVQQLAREDYNVHLTLRKGDSLVELADGINQLADVLRARRS